MFANVRALSETGGCWLVQEMEMQTRNGDTGTIIIGVEVSRTDGRMAIKRVNYSRIH